MAHSQQALLFPVFEASSMATEVPEQAGRGGKITTNL